jgi:hypothetical protein
LKTEEFYSKLKYLELSIIDFSKKYTIDTDDIRQWNDETNPIPSNIESLLLSCEYIQKFEKLQREFLEIKKTAKWFESHHQAMYDFVVKTQKYTEFKINDYNIIVRIGNENFGFKHLILRHYGMGSDGEITALDILKVGNVIKQDISIPAKGKNKLAFIQTKNNTKYMVILRKEKSGKLLFNFFSNK